MRDLDHQIRRYLDATAPAVDVEFESGGSTTTEDDTVISFAEHPRQRDRRVRTLAVVAAIAILAVGVAGLLAVRDDPGTTIESDDAATTIDAPPEETVPEPSARPSGVRGETLEWVRGAVPNQSPLEFVQLLSDGKRFYWLGDRIFTSLDGTTWEPIDFDGGIPTRLLDGRRAEAVWAGQLIQSELFPPLGSPSGDPAVSVEIVGIDGSVRSSTLSAPTETLTSATVITEIQQSQATIGARGALVVARLSVQDYQPLLADVLGSEAESVISVRLDRQAENETLEVELPARTERIALVGQGVNTSDFEVAPTGPIAWHSADGVIWTLIPASGPFAQGVEASTFVTGTASGFFALTRSDPFSDVGSGWFSTDGLAWSELDGDPPCCDVPAPWSTRALITTTDGSGFLTADADGITPLPGSGVDPLTEAHRSLGAGEAGIAYLVDLEPPVEPTFDIVFSPDGISWRRQALPDGIGDLYCCFFDNYGVVVGAETVAVLSAAGGELELWLGTPAAIGES